MSTHDSPCPCHPAHLYSNCCGPYHQQQKVAATPEVLMRSRYSAFALGKLEYLRQTWLPATCPADLNLAGNPQWVSLEVVSGGIHKYPRHHLGHVHFRAVCRDTDGQLHLLDERSRFEKVSGQWLYVDGDNSFSAVTEPPGTD